MRILVLPTISKKSLAHESCFLVFWQIAQAMPQHFWYFVLSRDADASELRFPNMHFIKEEDLVEYNTVHCSWPSNIDKYFHRMFGKYPVDLIFTSRSPLAALLQQKMTNVRSKARIPIFIFVTKALGKNETHDQIFENDLMLRGLSYATCPTMFLTNYEKHISLKAMRPYFSGVTIKRADEKGKIICQGVDVDRITRIIADTKKHDKLTLLFGGRLVGNKRWDDIIKLYWDARVVSGGKYGIEVVAPGGGSRIGGESLGSQIIRDVNFNTGLSQEDAWRKLAQAHISMAWSQYEGLPVGFVEQIICGLVFLCVDRPWSRATFGDDYPFFFKNEMQARALLRWACNHLHKAQDAMIPIRERLIEKYSLTTTAEILDSWFKEGVKESYFTTLPTTDLTNVYNELPNSFTLQDFVNGILKYKPGYAQGLCQEYVGVGTAELTRRDVMNWLRTKATDLQDGPMATFEKDR